MPKQVISTVLEYATPTATVALSLGSGSYYKVRGARLSANNDNATAAVQVQAVVSRASDPLSAGGIAVSEALSRGDGLLLAETMAAGADLIVGELTGGDFVIDSEQLFSADAGAYLGLRAVGLESGKVVNVSVELDLDTTAQTTTSTGVYLSQVVKFQDV